MELYRLISNLNLRPNPSPDPPSLGVYPNGTVVEKIGINAAGTWLQVRVRKTDGSVQEGWMSLKFLTKLPAAPLKWRLGVNLREFAYYGSGANQVKFTQESLRAQQLTVCQQNGIKLVRFFASRHDFEIDACIPFIRKALDTLNSFGMQAVVCLDDSLNGADQYMRGNDGFHTGDGGHLVTSYWRQKAYRNAYLPALRKIVGAFKTHPAVFIWELGNEYGLYPQPPQADDDDFFYEFVKEASGEIKHLASPNQLVALGLISTHHVFSQSAADDRHAWAKRLYQLPTVDAVGVHYYRDNYDDLKAFIKIDCDVAGELSKPFYVGELGAKENSGNRPAYYASEIDGWKQADAMSVLLWQLDSSPMDVGVSDDRGIARWKPVGDYQAILDQIKTRA